MDDGVERKRRERELADAVQTHRGPLLTSIRKMVRDQREADDVIQEVFEEYVLAYDLGKAVEGIGSWLVTVARNKVIDRFRRKKTQTDFIASEIAVNEGSEGVENSPEDESRNNWLREQLLDALDLLPEEQRDAFVRHELQGQSFEEISEATGVGVNTLLARKRYAVLFLREHLKEIYNELE